VLVRAPRGHRESYRIRPARPLPAPGSCDPDVTSVPHPGDRPCQGASPEVCSPSALAGRVAHLSGVAGTRTIPLRRWRPVRSFTHPIARVGIRKVPTRHEVLRVARASRVAPALAVLRSRPRWSRRRTRWSAARLPLACAGPARVMHRRLFSRGVPLPSRTSAAWPGRAFTSRRHSWGCTLRSVDPARGRRRVSAVAGPPAVSRPRRARSFSPGPGRAILRA
jgi:hypothetical protein